MGLALVRVHLTVGLYTTWLHVFFRGLSEYKLDAWSCIAVHRYTREHYSLPTPPYNVISSSVSLSSSSPLLGAWCGAKLGAWVSKAREDSDHIPFGYFVSLVYFLTHASGHPCLVRNCDSLAKMATGGLELAFSPSKDHATVQWTRGVPRSALVKAMQHVNFDGIYDDKKKNLK